MNEKIVPNNIYHGDAYELIKQLSDNSVDLIVTDPPYKWTKGGDMTGLFRKGVSSRKYMNKIEEKKLDKSINLSILDEFVRVMKKINIYIFCNKEQIYDYMKYFIEVKKCYFNILVWKKPNVTPLINNKYLSDTEFILFFREKGVPILGEYNTKHTVYFKGNMDEKKLYEHPNVKPLEIVRNLIINSSSGNDVILDPFLGSGTTAVASKELGRKYIGFEIDKEFYDIAKNRLNGINANGQTSVFTDFDLIEE